MLFYSPHYAAGFSVEVVQWYAFAMSGVLGDLFVRKTKSNE